MPSHILGATHLSRTAKWTTLENQISVFPHFLPLQSIFFFSPFLASFRLHNFPRSYQVEKWEEIHIFLQQCWNWNSVLLISLLLHNLQYCRTGLLCPGPFSHSLRHPHIRFEGSDWVFLGSWMKPDQSLNSLLV